MKRDPLKILCLSDLHGTLPDLSDYLDGHEVICITGDILPLNIQSETISSISWLAFEFRSWCQNIIDSSCVSRIYIIWGNHDFVGEQLRIDKHGNHRKANRVCQKLLWPNYIKLLDDNASTYKGYIFYGTSWCPELKNWAFYQDSEGLKSKFSKIPGNTDVLLTHCAPAVETYGTVLQQNWNYMTDFGCVELADAIKSKKPRLSIFGHIHSGDHVARDIDGTMFCNCSIKDEEYIPYFYPKTFILKDDSVEYIKY